MKPQHPVVREEELHAYVDGQLDPERRAVIEAYLEGQPEAAARVLAWTRQNDAMHALYDPVLSEPVPTRLSDAARRRTGYPLLRHAAAIAWITVGALGGWFVNDALREPPALVFADTLAHRAALAHAVYTPEVLHPVEVDATQEQHLVRWLSKRLNRELHTPDLRGFGYELVGGRLLPGGAGPAAQFMYQNASGGRLTLYITVDQTGGGPTAFRYKRENGLNVLYWVDRDLGFALSADAERGELLDIGHAVYRAVAL